MKRFVHFITESELKNSVSAYIAADYGGPNHDLRSSEGKHSDDWTKSLDAGMKPTRGAKVLHRGISGGALDASSLKVGDVIKDHAYISTSTNGGIASTFAAYKSGDDKPIVRMKIHAPAGTRTISVKQVLRGQHRHNKGEDEHILARGTHLRVDKIEHRPPTEDNKHHFYHIHATVVHQEH